MTVNLSRSKNHISSLSSKKIHEICKKLNFINVNHFCHDITFGKGEMSMLTSMESMFEFYYKNQFPMIFSDESGRTLDSGIYLSSYLKEKDIGYQEITQKLSKEFLITSMKVIHVVEKEIDHQNTYSFVIDIPETINFSHYAINQIHHIKNFIEKYKVEEKDLILEVKKQKNRIKLPFSDSINLATSKLNHRRKDMTYYSDNNIDLTSRQLEILKLYLSCKTAKEAGRLLNISYRTFEKTIEIIKQKLNAKSKHDFLRMAYKFNLTDEYG